MVDMDKHIWEGWTVGDFIEELDYPLENIQRGRGFVGPFRTRKELAEWCADEQPYYKKQIPEVVNYFAEKYGI